MSGNGTKRKPKQPPKLVPGKVVPTTDTARNAGQPGSPTPSAGGTTTTTSRTGATKRGDAFIAGAQARGGGTGVDMAASVALLRQRLLSGEDLSVASKVGDQTLGQQTVQDEQTTAIPLPGGRTRTDTRSRTVGELLDELTTFGPDELERLQHQLYAGGYYSQAFYNSPADNPVKYRDRFDQDTRRAYSLLLLDGLAYKDLTIDRILADRGQQFAESGQLASGHTVSRDGNLGGGKLYQTVIDDPAAIRETAKDLAVKILGREPDKATLAKYVTMVQGLQRAEQHHADAATESNTRRNFDAQVTQDDANLGGKAAVAAGNLPNPVAGGTFSNTLGAPRDGGKRKHMGTDIFAAEGTPVTAAIGGTVLKTGFDKSGGNRVWVQGDDGRAYYYAHLHDITAKVGERLSVGQQLGTVGKTGNASHSSPHLHFSINSKMGHEDAIGNPALEITGHGGTNALHNAADVYIAPQYTETTQVDASARLAEQIRKDNPTEAGAHDFAQQYDVFREFVNRGGAAGL